MQNYRINSAVITLGIHICTLFIIGYLLTPAHTIKEPEEDLYLVDLMTPPVAKAPIKTIEQQRHAYFKPQLAPAGNLINALSSKPLSRPDTTPSHSKKIPFSPQPRILSAKSLTYAQRNTDPLAISPPQQEGASQLYLPSSTAKTSSAPPLPPRQAKAMPNNQSADELLAYQQAIKSKILSAKIYPLNARKRGQEGVICLRFLLSQNGHLKDIKLINPCQYELLNQAAIQTILEAGPFQPIPASLNQEEVWIKLALSFALTDVPCP